MHAPRSRSRLRAAMLGITAAGAVVLAFSSPVMAGITRPSQGPSPLKYANEVLKLPAARTTVAAPTSAIYEVKLDAPRQAQGREKPPPKPPAKLDSIPYFEFMVEKPVALPQGKEAQEAPNTMRPRYPDILRQAGVEGRVIAQFVVRPTGVDTATFKVISSTHALFTQAVINALPGMRFTPAEVGGRQVAQLIQQEFEFNVAGSAQSAEKIREDTIRRSNPPVVYRVNKVVITVPDVRKP